MHWEVYLNRPEAVLDDLVHALEKGEPTLARVGDQFVLRSRTFENLADAAAVRRKTRISVTWTVTAV
jgi:hypothetical protein